MTNLRETRGKFQTYASIEASFDTIVYDTPGFGHMRMFVAGTRGYMIGALSCHSRNRAFLLLEKLCENFSIVRPAKPANPPVAEPMPKTKNSKGA